MNIRQATLGDALQLSSLCGDVQRLHAEAYPDLFRMPEGEDFAHGYFSEILADPTVTVYIAEENGKAVGYVFCRLVEWPENPFMFAFRTLLIEHVSVRPDSQGKGTGAALMQRAQWLAREMGVSRIQLDSWEFNTVAHGFFESQGFQKFNYRFWKHL